MAASGGGADRSARTCWCRPRPRRTHARKTSQADAAYRWQLNEPRRIEPEEEGAETVRPHKNEGVTANLTAAYSPVERLFLILELNSVTVMRGDDELKERVHLYLTPGVSVEPAEGWNHRAEVHLPVTRARELNSRIIVIATKGS